MCMKKIELIDTRNNDDLFNFAIDIIFKEWGDGDLAHLVAKKQNLKNDDTRKCFVLVVDDTPIGCFVICENDIKGYPEYNPNLACVCIAEQFRGQGYSKIMLNKANEEFRNLNIKKAYLKTNLNNFYDKFGWIYEKDINVDNCIEKLYYQYFE